MLVACPWTFAANVDAVMTATVDGKPWSASFSQGITLEMAGKPVLNLSGTQQGSPTMTFNSMLVLTAPTSLVGTYQFKNGFPANGADLNVLDSGALVGHVRFSSGEVAIDGYDSTRKTISGHFSAAGKGEDGRLEEIKDGTFSGIPVGPQ